MTDNYGLGFEQSSTIALKSLSLFRRIVRSFCPLEAGIFPRTTEIALMSQTTHNEVCDVEPRARAHAMTRNKAFTVAN